MPPKYDSVSVLEVLRNTLGIDDATMAAMGINLGAASSKEQIQTIIQNFGDDITNMPKLKRYLFAYNEEQKKKKPKKVGKGKRPLIEVETPNLLLPSIQSSSTTGMDLEYDVPANFGQLGSNNRPLSFAPNALYNTRKLDAEQGQRAIRGAYMQPGGFRKAKSSYNMRRPKGMYSERQLAQRALFSNEKWREDHLYGKRVSVAQFLSTKPKARNMQYTTSKGVTKYRVSAAARGLLRSKASRKKFWPSLEEVIPEGARSITDLDAAKAMANYERAKKAKTGSRSFSVKRENPF